MPRRWIMFVLFLSSYAPLFLLVGLRSVGRSDVVTIACGVLIFLGALGTVVFLQAAERKPTGTYQLLEVADRNGDVAAYAATYLLPFVTVFSGEWQDVATLAAFVVFLGVLYVRSRLIYVNPVLSILGYHLWSVIPKTAGDDSADSKSVAWPKYLLADTEAIRKGQVIRAHRVTPTLLLFDEDVDGDS